MKKIKAELTDIICPICKEALLREKTEDKKGHLVCTNNECHTEFRKENDELIGGYLNKTHKIEHVSYEQFVDMSKEFFARLGDEQEIEEEREYREWREKSTKYIARYLQEELGISID